MFFFKKTHLRMRGIIMTRKECYEIFEFDDNIILTEQKIENKYEELFNANSSAKKLKLIDEAYVTLMNRSFSDSNNNILYESAYIQEICHFLCNMYESPTQS